MEFFIDLKMYSDETTSKYIWKIKEKYHKIPTLKWSIVNLKHRIQKYQKIFIMSSQKT